MTYFPLRIATAVAAAGLWLAGLNGSQAAIVNVAVATNNTFTFNPAVVNINVGDQVKWTWYQTDGHTTTSGSSCGVPSGTWNMSGSSGSTFTFTFSTAGNFPYYCSPHCTFGMTGQVNVSGVATVPSIQVTAPTNGTVYAVPANVTINASASDTGGTITGVQFLVDANVLASQTTGPFSATTNNLAAGSHLLTAIATDSGGVKATNKVNISVVAPSPIMLSTMGRSGATFHFVYGANAGLTYFVQRSTNLLSVNWLTIATNQASGSSVNFTDLNATVDSGFYRVGQAPNP